MKIKMIPIEIEVDDQKYEKNIVNLGYSAEDMYEMLNDKSKK